MMSEQRLRKFLAGDIPYPDMGSGSLLVEGNFPCDMTNRKHYADLGSDTSSVWNYCSHCSDVILRGIQWWRQYWLFSQGNRGK